MRRYKDFMRKLHEVSRKERVHVILAVTFGNILEWYEVYSYVFLAPVLGKLFFDLHSKSANLFMAFLIFGIGFLTRPIGGLLFGRWGDLHGRKSAFIGSIVIMTVPTFAMGCLMPIEKWGIAAPILLIVLRLLQSLPESGESPGTACFLYENATPKNKAFMTSWMAFGNQLGALIGMFEVLVVDKFIPEEFLIVWGWRIAFWFGGVIGLFGFFLRKTLHETPIFHELKVHHEVDTESFRQVIYNHRGKIWLGTAFGIVNAATFYFLAAYLPNYLTSAIGLGIWGTAFFSISLIVLITVLLPVFGMWGDRVGPKPFLIGSSVLILALLLPMSLAIDARSMVYVEVLTYIYAIPVAAITALYPVVLLDLFEAPVRFTGAGLAFNLADGFIGGFTPAIAIFLVSYLNNQAAFSWFILACTLISLFAYCKIPKRTFVR
ncbi:MAG: MFS transporter [Chlamydiales bacterium]|nr:MFS transporter [Chlamydiales bacterium]